ncbi:MAG: endonuclease/exonuclease/phosphatase family protein [Nostocoides sp.]
MTLVRVATYNTRDLLDDRAAAARVIRAIDPDVLCLQEVPRRLFATTRVAAFARLAGMLWVGRHRGSGGTTIFTSSRVRVTSAHHARLAVRWPDRTRGYAVASVRAGDCAPVRVVSVHLSLGADERERHTASILASLGSGTRTVICGDLNEDETGHAWQLIGGGLRLVSPPDPTYPSFAPKRRLDVVFATPDLTVLPRTPVVFDRDELARASDHRPTWVDLDL